MLVLFALASDQHPTSLDMIMIVDGRDLRTMAGR